MKLNVSDRYHASVIAIQGKFLGSLHADDFRTALDGLKQEGKTNIVVDLSETEFMDSSAIGTLIGGLTSIRKVGGDVRLAGMEKRIRHVFLITKLLGPVFEDYETVEEAETSFNTSPPTRVEA